MKAKLLQLFFKKYYSKIDTGESVITSKQLAAFSNSVCYEKGQNISFDYPNYFFHPEDKTAYWIEDLKKTTSYQGSFYSVLQNATLIGENATVIHHGKIILDSFFNSKGYLKKNGERWHLRYPYLFKTEKKIDCAMSLCNGLNHSFFHWLTEAMPLLEALFLFEKDNLDIEVKLIVPNSPFVEPYLNLLGIESKRLIFWNYTKVKVITLVVPSLRYARLESHKGDWAQHIYTKSSFDFLRDRLKISDSAIHTKNKIYVSRKDVGSRLLKNEAELEIFLQKFGYKSVVLQDLTIREQINLFSNCSHLITAHGAGLANCVFGDNIHVIELFPENRGLNFTYHFYQIASYFGHEHHLVFCACDEKENVSVDWIQLEQILKVSLKIK